MSEQGTEDPATKPEEQTEQKAQEQPEDASQPAEITSESKPSEETIGENPAEPDTAKETEAEPTAAAETEKQEEEEEEEPEDGVPIVLVTGASGFVATHVIKQLLEQGRYHVRGTVRSKKREEKVKPLLELVPDAKYPLRLVEADLSKPDTWAKAVKRCTYVLHVASPFILNVTDEAAIIRTAVEGTTNVLQACADAGTVKRVVVTSSVAAVSCGMTGNPEKPADHVYTEKDWSIEAACSPYEKSKLKAELAAWDFVKELDESKRFELTVVNPGYVQGPFLSASSGEGSKEVVDRILGNKMPGLPDSSFCVIDVRDVAAAQIAAMEKPEAAGNRYILVNKVVHMREFSQIIGNEFQPQGYKVPTKNIPKSIIWVGKLFSPSLKTVYRTLGKVLQYNNERMVNELGIQPRPVEESIIDQCYSLIDLGLAKKTPGYLGHPSKRPPPPEPEPQQDEATAGQEEPPSQEKPVEGETAETQQPASEEGQKSEDKPASEEGQKSEDKPADDEQTSKDQQGDEKAAEDQPADQQAEEEKPAGGEEVSETS